jgi:hypothetical protein
LKFPVSADADADEHVDQKTEDDAYWERVRKRNE